MKMHRLNLMAEGIPLNFVQELFGNVEHIENFLDSFTTGFYIDEICEVLRKFSVL